MAYYSVSVHVPRKTQIYNYGREKPHTMGDFLDADKARRKHEGGWNHVPGDNGQETYQGIARKFWPKWEGWPKVDSYKPLKHNQFINDAELESMVRTFYRINFWDKIKGDQIDDHEYAKGLYDRALNKGIKQAVIETQIAHNIEPTGKMDEKTLDAINNPDKYLLS